MEKLPDDKRSLPAIEIQRLSTVSKEKDYAVISRSKAVYVFLGSVLLITFKDYPLSVLGILGVIFSYIFLWLYIQSDFRLLMGEKTWNNLCRQKGTLPHHAKSQRRVQLVGSSSIKKCPKRRCALISQGKSFIFTLKLTTKIKTKVLFTCLHYIFPKVAEIQPWIKILGHPGIILSSQNNKTVTNPFAKLPRLTAIHKHKPSPAIASNSMLSETEQENLEGVSKSILHSNLIWRNRNLTSILCLYCLLKESHWYDVKRATKRRVFHGHTRRIVGVINHLRNKKRIEN